MFCPNFSFPEFCSPRVNSQDWLSHRCLPLTLLRKLSFSCIVWSVPCVALSSLVKIYLPGVDLKARSKQIALVIASMYLTLLYSFSGWELHGALELNLDQAMLITRASDLYLPLLKQDALESDCFLTRVYFHLNRRSHLTFAIKGWVRRRFYLGYQFFPRLNYQSSGCKASQHLTHQTKNLVLLLFAWNCLSSFCMCL